MLRPPPPVVDAFQRLLNRLKFFCVYFIQHVIMWGAPEGGHMPQVLTGSVKVGRVVAATCNALISARSHADWASIWACFRSPSFSAHAAPTGGLEYGRVRWTSEALTAFWTTGFLGIPKASVFDVSLSIAVKEGGLSARATHQSGSFTRNQIDLGLDLNSVRRRF